MTAHPEIEALRRRMAALEQEQFALVERLRRLDNATERNADAVDQLEDVLTELAWLDTTRAGLDDARAQRDAQLQTDSPVPAAPAAADTPLAPEAAPAPQAQASVEVPELPVLWAWVETHIAPLVRKTTTTGEGGGIRWCRQWWHHTDAVDRFTALYLAWQELSTEDSATWRSVYLRDHLDPHLATLTSPYGPFHACHPRRHSSAIEALGTDPLPPETVVGESADLAVPPRTPQAAALPAGATTKT